MNSNYRSSMNFMAGFVLFLLQVSVPPAFAQPSGGPYGPVQQTYSVPQGAGRQFYVAVDGSPEQSGGKLTAPTTLDTAIAQARTGDVIVMRGGTYRTGNLLLNQGIAIQPYADEKPVLKGTLVAATWEKPGQRTLDHEVVLIFFPLNPPVGGGATWKGKRTPLHRFNNDMVFVDGKFLQAVGWEGEVDENTYYIDYDTGLGLHRC